MMQVVVSEVRDMQFPLRPEHLLQLPAGQPGRGAQISERLGGPAGFGRFFRPGEHRAGAVIEADHPARCEFGAAVGGQAVVGQQPVHQRRRRHPAPSRRLGQDFLQLPVHAAAGGRAPDARQRHQR
jgi:hypothetical protein